MLIEKNLIVDQEQWDQEASADEKMREWFRDENRDLPSFPCVLIVCNYYGDLDYDTTEFLLVELKDFRL